MVDKVCPLKLEQPGKGTQLDFGPKEADPTEDYLAAKGIAFENSDDTTIRGDAGVMKFKDSDVTVEVTLEDLLNGGTGASPGFSFGRSGAVNAGTWLRRPGNVPSNRAGVTIPVDNPVVREVSCSNRNIDSYTLEIWEHEGNLVNQVLLGTVSVVGARGGTFAVNFPTTRGKQIAVRLATGGGSVRDLGADVVIRGNVT